MKIPLCVLIVEDSEDDAQLLVRALRRGGYGVVAMILPSSGLTLPKV